MINYLEEFNKLPQNLKEQVSSPAALCILGSLEDKYHVELATLAIKIMIKEVAIKNLPQYLISELKLEPLHAENLTKELIDKIFIRSAEYLELGEVNEYNRKVANVVAEIFKRANGHIESDATARWRADLAGRLYQVLKMYLRGVRSKIDTKNTLLKSVDTGGLDLDANSTEEILKITEELKTAMEIGNDNPNITADLQSVLGKNGLKADFDFSHQLPSPSVKKVITLDDLDLSDKKPVAPIVATPSPEPAPVPVAKEVEPTTKIMPAFTPIVGAERKKDYVVKDIGFIAPGREFRNDGKTRVEDVKEMYSKNSVDDFKYMDLASFRRLGVSPQEAVDKIKYRFEELAKEDYEKNLAAISAWRQSPVNKWYLKIVNLSIVDGQDIAKTIEALRGKGVDCLTFEEFEAILEMNKELRRSH